MHPFRHNLLISPHSRCTPAAVCPSLPQQPLKLPPPTSKTIETPTRCPTGGHKSSASRRSSLARYETTLCTLTLPPSTSRWWPTLTC